MKKIIIAILILTLCITMGCIKASPTISAMDIWAFSIGQADSILLSYDGVAILIDTGEKDDGEDIVKALAANGIDEIDLLVITHFDKDHIGGLPTIADTITIRNVWMPDYERDSKTYTRMIDALANNSIPFERISENRTVQFGAATLELWASPIEYAGADNDDNEQSLVMAVSYGKCRMLFMGDANGAWLSKLCYGTYNLTCDLVKMPYHGNWEANMITFIATSLPQHAIITDSSKNPASESTLDALNAIGTSIYQTKNGSVHLQCDGQKITEP